YRFLICMKPSAVRRSGDDATLTYSAPICLRKRSWSSVGLAEDCAHSLIPGWFRRIAAELLPADPRNATAPNVPVSVILPKSLRSGWDGTPTVSFLDS